MRTPLTSFAPTSVAPVTCLKRARFAASSGQPVVKLTSIVLLAIGVGTHLATGVRTGFVGTPIEMMSVPLSPKPSVTWPASRLL